MRNVVGRPPFAWAEGLQYSQAVTAGDLVFTAGQGGFGDDGEVVEGGFEAQLRRTFANVDAALGSLGASLATIAKLTVYLVDKGDYETFKRVRAELLTAPWPASTAVVVRELLVDGMLVEIDAVAVVGSSRLER
jgi:enamine deaminase RidA (YjgF/YER057c/UK114 family)